MGKTKNAWWKHRLIATLLVVMTVFATCITPALAAYNKNVDYGQKMAQLAQAGKANSPEYKAAQAARNEKIKDMYGGKEPPLNGSTNGTRLSDVLNNSNYGGGSYGNAGSSAGNRYNNGNGSDISNGQANLIIAAIAASGNGKISSDQCRDVINAVTNAASGKGKVSSDDPLTSIVAKVLDNDPNKLNRDLAADIINHDYSNNLGSRTNDAGEVAYWEGGKLYWVDKSGDTWKVRADNEHEAQPGAKDLTQAQINEIFKIRQQFEELPNDCSAAERNRIHDAAEDFRKNNGYTGGLNGSMFTGKNDGSNYSGGSGIPGGTDYTPTPPTPTPPTPPTPSNPTPEAKQEEYYVFAQVSGGHGSVSPATSTVKPGGSVTVRMTPDEGYQVKSVVIVPFDMDKGYMSEYASSVKPSNNSYTLKNIKNNWAVVVSFEIKATIDGVDGEVTGTNMSVGANGKAPSTKSGYGVAPKVTNIQTTNAVVDKVTAKNTATGKTYTLQPSGSGWVMPVNKDSVTGARVDYLPPKTADGDYKWVVTVYAHNEKDPDDILEPYVVEFKYTIKGSMYEDDFTGDKN